MIGIVMDNTQIGVNLFFNNFIFILNITSYDKMNMTIYPLLTQPTTTIHTWPNYNPSRAPTYF